MAVAPLSAGPAIARRATAIAEDNPGRRKASPCVLAASSSLSPPALAALAAAECGADKLGTSRIVEVGHARRPGVGLKTYPKTIPLADHEVILTFDDGPDAGDDAAGSQGARRPMRPRDLLRHRPQGRGAAGAGAARGRPKGTPSPIIPSPIRSRRCATWARRGAGRHPQGHDRRRKSGLWPGFQRRRTDRSRELKLHAPFFRFPGFADTPDLRDWFAANNVGIFGVDLWASDWVEMTPEEELKLILGRLEKAERGMMLFHDNRQWTADMLPAFLRELKKRGYRVVHMVAGPGRGPTVAGAARLGLGDRAGDRRAEAAAGESRRARTPRSRSRSSRRRASSPAT